MMHWFNFGGPYGHGMWGLGPVFMMIFWALIVIGIIYCVKGILGRSCQTPKQETALDILKKRYAAGEITAEEYDVMKAKLTE